MTMRATSRLNWWILAAIALSSAMWVGIVLGVRALLS